MRDKVKLLLFIGIICCAVGAILAGIGALFGGKNYVMNADLNHLSGSATRRNDDSFLRKEQKQFSELKNVKMNVNFEDIRIESSEDENFYLSYPVWKDKNGEKSISYEEKDGTLNLKEKKGVYSNGVFINIDVFDILEGDESSKKKDYRIVLSVPKDKTLDSLTVSSSMGDLEIDTANTKKVDIRSSSGDIKISNFSADEGKIEAQDGDAKIENSTFDAVKFHSSMGDIQLENLTWKEGDISMGDGDMTMKNCSLENTKFNSSMGSLTLRDVTWDAGSIYTADGDIAAKDFEPLGKLEIESDMGDVSIEIADDILDNISYDVKTDYGAIHVLDKFGGKLRENDDVATFSKSADKEKAKLSIESHDGDITIG